MSQFISTLEVTPLPDGLQWRLNRSLQYLSDILRCTIEVPAGFITDFASIPRGIWNILPPWGRYGPAAVVHDWLYWQHVGPKTDADAVLREAMLMLGVDKLVVEEIYTAVHLFGGPAWDHNAALKTSGYTRMAGSGSIPPYAQLPDLGATQS